MDAYLTIEEAAEYLKVHPETVRRWVKKGRVKAYKGERIIRFKTVDLDKIFTNND